MAFGPKERALLLLRQLQGEEADGASWRAELPLSEREEFNEYVGLLNAATCDLTVLVCGLVQTVERLELKYALRQTLAGWGEDARRLRRLLGCKPGEKTRFSELGQTGLGKQMKADLESEVETAWQDLQAIGQVLSEIAFELDGNEALMPATRDSYEDCEETLLALSEQLGLRLPDEPDLERVEMVRQYAQQRSELSPTVYLYKEGEAASWRRGNRR